MATATASKSDEIRLAGKKREHDKLLEQQPEDATHDSRSCFFCAMDEDTPRGGSVSDKTFTQEDLDAAIAKAVGDAKGPLEEQVRELRAAQGQSEVEAQVAEATQPLEARIAELEAELDNKTNEAETQQKRADGIVAWLEEEGQKAEQAQANEARKAERTEKVREAANFSDEYVEQNAERWAAMDDEAFEAAVDGWREQAAAASNGALGRPATSELPRETALQASRENGGKSTGRTSAVREVMGLRRRGVDPRRITR
jgi:hypothetical protein